MNHADYLAHDATALAARVAAGDVTPDALLDLALAQQTRVHGRVNAVVRLMEPEARAQASWACWRGWDCSTRLSTRLTRTIRGMCRSRSCRT